VEGTDVRADDGAAGVGAASRATSAEDSRLPPIPGLLVRRSQQAHTALWALCVPEDVSQPQFAILRVLTELGWTDQTTLGRLAALDRSNAAEVLARLAQRQLVRHRRDETDRRRKLWALTDEGEQLYRRTRSSAAAVNELLLAPLEAEERSELLRLLELLVTQGERRVERMQAERLPPSRSPASRRAPGPATAG
jgi:DNA-binding MarR family transcriptional regulator